MDSVSVQDAPKSSDPGSITNKDESGSIVLKELVVRCDTVECDTGVSEKDQINSLPSGHVIVVQDEISTGDASVTSKTDGKTVPTPVDHQSNSMDSSDGNSKSDCVTREASKSSLIDHDPSQISCVEHFKEPLNPVNFVGENINSNHSQDPFVAVSSQDCSSAVRSPEKQILESDIAGDELCLVNAISTETLKSVDSDRRCNRTSPLSAGKETDECNNMNLGHVLTQNEPMNSVDNSDKTEDLGSVSLDNLSSSVSACETSAAVAALISDKSPSVLENEEHMDCLPLEDDPFEHATAKEVNRSPMEADDVGLRILSVQSRQESFGEINTPVSGLLPELCKCQERNNCMCLQSNIAAKDNNELLINHRTNIATEYTSRSSEIETVPSSSTSEDFMDHSNVQVLNEEHLTSKTCENETVLNDCTSGGFKERGSQNSKSVISETNELNTVPSSSDSKEVMDFRTEDVAGTNVSLNSNETVSETHSGIQPTETGPSADNSLESNASVVGKDISLTSRSLEESGVNKTLSNKTTGEKEKSLSELEGDEGVCIVPDTEPRVPTDKEKADAVEKANKGDVPEKERKCVITPNDCTLLTNLSEKTSDTTETIELQKPRCYGQSTRKFGIQLVSTSSLVSRQISTTPEKVETIQDIPDFLGVQNAVQLPEGQEEQTCSHCSKTTKCKYFLKNEGEIHLCEDDCYNQFRKKNDSQVPKITIRPRKLDNTFFHKCGECSMMVDVTSEKALGWETMDFCAEECLEKYQKTLGSHCANCKGPVQAASLGKYCVRFGYDMKQFCSAHCLEDFKKGLKVCSYCQKDISGGAEGFLAPVGDKGQFKDFCTPECMEKYDQMSHNSAPPVITHECAVCNEEKTVTVEVLFDSKIQKLCSEPCFAAFKFVNNIDADQCGMCKKYYDHNRSENFTVFYDDAPHSFCCKTCMNVYILAKRKIVPCSWCKVKKYNFDMIKKISPSGHTFLMMCSLHCLSLYQGSPPTASSGKKVACEFCNSPSPTQYHLTMSDASVRGFCSSNCVMTFQGKFPKTPLTVPGDRTPYPLGLPRKIVSKKMCPLNASVGEKDHASLNNTGSMPVISSVTSLAPVNAPSSSAPATAPSTIVTTKTTEGTKTVFKQQFIIRPPVHPSMANCAVQVNPKNLTKAVSCHPQTCTISTQTDESAMKPIVIPIPVPIFIPAPMRMYSSPYPVPVPIALPIPVPFFIPTTKNSTEGILKDIKRIQEKIPSDPFEAELLMMAEMVAKEKKGGNSDSESDCGNSAQDAHGNKAGSVAGSELSPENVDTSNTLSEDVLQIALKMASELVEPAESFDTAVTKTHSSLLQLDTKSDLEKEVASERLTKSGRKRAARPHSRSPSANSKRVRKSSSSSDQSNTLPFSESSPGLKEEPLEKPDAHLCLKFTLGVNAWRSWVSQENAAIEKAGGSSRKIKLFKQSLLELTADELNYSLCNFIKKVRKPDGNEYSPDIIYYFCLGIQQYLIENGRVDNIFNDPYYENFTVCLDELIKEFSLPCNDAQRLESRVEEEHLWESKLLGAHSPYVLLNTMMFFNTKHFNLTTVEEHMQLSFSHIMKHWKKPPNASSGPNKLGSLKTPVLKFYPPPALSNTSKKKKVYEQDENKENPLKCPVKLYEFYLSKCPESVKSRNDVFYLLPERSCVPDSPVWYSTMALGQEQLHKMLHRIRMIREIAVL